MLPQIFAKLHPRSRAPWVAILVLAVCWALCLRLGFERLVTLDILIYGASLMLEFAALVALRLREPGLARPFRVPGGLLGAVLVGLLPGLLLVISIIRGEHETLLGLSSTAFGVVVIGLGVAAYILNHFLKPQGWIVPAPSEPEVTV
jgi:amino acid transporter